jgi:hypothetical protein
MDRGLFVIAATAKLRHTTWGILKRWTNVAAPIYS